MSELPDDARARPMTREQRERILRAEGVGTALTLELFDGLVAAREAGGEDTPEYALRILNGFELVLLVQFELNVFLRGLLEARTHHEELLYARLIVHSVHEGSKTLRGVLDHRFRESYQLIVDDPRMDSELKSSHSGICEVFRTSEHLFGDVRDGLSGHKHKDAAERVRLLRSAQPGLVVDLQAEFLEALHGLHEAQYHLTQALRSGLE